MKRRGNQKFLCCLQLTATVAMLLGTNPPPTYCADVAASNSGPHSEIEVVSNEHIFTAGNDTTGTAAITYASRLNNHRPVTYRFENYTFPESCSSHPSRCRSLIYSSTSTSDNYTRLIFYVPLAEKALGVMELAYDNRTLSHVVTRAVTTGLTRRCSPISMVDISGTFYVICISDRQQLMSCEVRNSRNVSTLWLSCPMPEFHINLSRLSNFVLHDARFKDLYFTHENFMCRKLITSNSVQYLAQLPSSYSHCWHLELLDRSEPIIAAYCNLRSDSNKIQSVYFNLNTQFFTEQMNATKYVRYDCPSQGTFVEVSIAGAYASYMQRDVYMGSFNIIGSTVTFAICFEFDNATHFLYRDRHLGTFIKPNISVNLQSRVEQLLKGPCQSPACEQPLVFKSQFILLLNQTSLSHAQWTFEVKDLQRGTIIPNFSVSDPSQVALKSDFVAQLIQDPPTTSAVPSDSRSNSKSVTITSTISASGVFVFLTIAVLSPTLIMVYCFRSGKLPNFMRRDRNRRSGPYSSVVDERQESVELSERRPLSGIHVEDEGDSFEEQQSAKDVMITNLASQGTDGSRPLDDRPVAVMTVDSSREGGEEVTHTSHSRQSSTCVSTREPRRDIDRPETLGQPSSPNLPQPVPSANTRTDDGSNTGGVALHSQHSNDSTSRTNSIPDDSISNPTLPQARRRPTSLISSPSTHSQDGTHTQTLTITNHPTAAVGVQRYNSNDSTTSNATHNSGGGEPTNVGISSSNSTAFHRSNSDQDTATFPGQTGGRNNTDNNSIIIDSGLPQNREHYRAVGASQEDVLRPIQAVHTSGSMSTSNGGALNSLVPQQLAAGNAQTPTGSGGGQMYPVFNTPSVHPTHNYMLGQGPPPLYTQRSYDSTVPGNSSQYPNNDLAASRTRRQSRTRSQSLSSPTSPPPTLHNTTRSSTGTGALVPGSPTHVHSSSSNGPSRLNSVESDTSQQSSDRSRQPSLTFFPSDPTSGSIQPPNSGNICTAQHATSVHNDVMAPSRV